MSRLVMLSRLSFLVETNAANLLTNALKSLHEQWANLVAHALCAVNES